MSKFSINVPTTDNRTVYGYMTKDGSKVYWKDFYGDVQYFDKSCGTSGTAFQSDLAYYKNKPTEYTPIYEPFTIAIGA